MHLYAVRMQISRDLIHKTLDSLAFITIHAPHFGLVLVHREQDEADGRGLELENNNQTSQAQSKSGQAGNVMEPEERASDEIRDMRSARAFTTLSSKSSFDCSRFKAAVAVATKAKHTMITKTRGIMKLLR